MVEAIFGSSRSQKICRFLVGYPNTAFSGAVLAKKLDEGERAVVKDLRMLAEAGVLQDAEGEYVLLRSFPLFAELQSIFLKTAVMMESACLEQLKGMPNLGLIVLTGRFVMRPESPVDLLLVGSVNRPKLAAMIRTFEKQGVSINYAVFTRAQFEARRSMTDRFLYGIFEGKHEILLDKWGVVSVTE